MKILLLGDENFTFSSGFLASHPNDDVEVGCCLSEDQLKDDTKPMLDKLKEKGIPIHFHVNPAQMKSSFGDDSYDQIVFVLPGLAFHGTPPFIETKSEMFRLRLHLFCFGFLKSAKPSIRVNGDIIFLWPDLDDDTVPFYSLEIDKLAKFCYVQRAKEHDVPFDNSFYQDWKPLIHNVTKSTLPSWLQSSRYYYFNMDDESKTEKLKQNKKKRKGASSTSDDKKDDNTNESSLDALTNDDDDKLEDFNILKIPPQIFNFDRNQLPHVNECFHFKLWGKNSQSFQISKLTLKYDPRISGWKGDGTVAKGVKDTNAKGRLGRGGKGIDVTRNVNYGMQGAPGVPNPSSGFYGYIGPPPPPPVLSYGGHHHPGSIGSGYIGLGSTPPSGGPGVPHSSGGNSGVGHHLHHHPPPPHPFPPPPHLSSQSGVSHPIPPHAGTGLPPPPHHHHPGLPPPKVGFAGSPVGGPPSMNSAVVGVGGGPPRTALHNHHPALLQQQQRPIPMDPQSSNYRANNSVMSGNSGGSGVLTPATSASGVLTPAGTSSSSASPSSTLNHHHSSSLQNRQNYQQQPSLPNNATSNSQQNLNSQNAPQTNNSSSNAANAQNRTIPQGGSTMGTARLVQMKRSNDPNLSNNAKRPKGTASTTPNSDYQGYEEMSTTYLSAPSSSRSGYPQTSPYGAYNSGNIPHDYYSSTGYADGYTDGYAGYVQGGYDAYRGAPGYDKSGNYEGAYNDYGSVGAPGYEALNYSSGDYASTNEYYDYAQGSYNHGYNLLNNMGYYDSMGAPRPHADATNAYAYDYSQAQPYDGYKADYNALPPNYEEYGYDTSRISATNPSYDSAYYTDGIYTAQGSTYTGAPYLTSTGKTSTSALSASHHSNASYNQYGRY